MEWPVRDKLIALYTTVSFIYFLKSNEFFEVTLIFFVGITRRRVITTIEIIVMVAEGVGAEEVVTVAATVVTTISEITRATIPTTTTIVMVTIMATTM